MSLDPKIPLHAPDFLFKIVSPQQWDESQGKDSLVLGEIDRTFIHLAKEDQVERVVSRFWMGAPHYVLKVQTRMLDGQLRYETNPGGSTRFYHLYEGSIPMTAVLAAEYFGD